MLKNCESNKNCTYLVGIELMSSQKWALKIAWFVVPPFDHKGFKLTLADLFTSGLILYIQLCSEIIIPNQLDIQSHHYSFIQHNLCISSQSTTKQHKKILLSFSFLSQISKILFPPFPKASANCIKRQPYEKYSLTSLQYGIRWY